MSLFTINTSVANVYCEPDFNSTMVTQALLGESCEVLNQHENWVLIRQWDGYEGWVNHFVGVHSGEPYMSSHI
ncbi:MAG: SH3 domain-containing protein, partial [Candidatus Marinimicrobia bacterium]|nr:SH3 domain-containing protein [Candidatus Neomarinimicrobiota bacterium]